MTAHPPRTVLVVPCYNEAERLRADDVRALIACPGIEVVLVDDGSTDDTAALLEQLAGNHPEVSVHSMDVNSGKAEAVRRGLLIALETRPDWVGFCDADMSTPAREVLRLNGIATTTPGLSVVLGSHVGLLGLDVQRSALRHYSGRIFATAASSILGVPVYDTQCGAKLFRCTATLRAALSEPFHSRWSFDVELLGRLLRGRPPIAAVAIDEFVEVPLNEWHDVEWKQDRTALVAACRPRTRSHRPTSASLVTPHSVSRVRARTLVAIGLGSVLVVLVAASIFTSPGPFYFVDSVNHYYLVQKYHGGDSLLHYTLNSPATGSFYPNYAMYGGSLYAVTAGIGTVVGSDWFAYGLTYLVAFGLAFGGVMWLSRLLGLRTSMAIGVGLIYVTSAYYLSNPFGRGAWPEFIATSAFPLVLAALVSVLTSEQPSRRSIAILDPRDGGVERQPPHLRGFRHAVRGCGRRDSGVRRTAAAALAASSEPATRGRIDRGSTSPSTPGS